MNWLWVFIGGGIGASLRYAAFVAIDQRWAAATHWGTLSVNIVGCFAIGLAITWLDDVTDSTAALRLFLITGVLGGFTTFSAFGLDAVRLAADDRILLAGVYALGTVAASIVAVAAAIALGRALQ